MPIWNDAELCPPEFHLMQVRAAATVLRQLLDIVLVQFP